jgi:hypothetical protein
MTRVVWVDELSDQDGGWAKKAQIVDPSHLYCRKICISDAGWQTVCVNSVNLFVTKQVIAPWLRFCVVIAHFWGARWKPPLSADEPTG